MNASEAREYLLALRAKVDEHFAQALARQPGQYACKSGCSTCCHQRFSVFEIEANELRSALQMLEHKNPTLRQRIRVEADEAQNQARCALLIDDRCSIYEHRPLICRTHGLASPQADSERGFDVCPLNFRTSTPHPRSLLSLERVNEPLALLADQGDSDARPAGTRTSLDALARAK